MIRYLLENPCTVCGEPDPVVLDFHHPDPTTKGGDVSDFVARGEPWRVVKEEIDRTSVMCACCHRRHHAHEEQNWRVRALKKLKGGK